MQWGRDRPAFLPKRALSLSPLYPSKSNDIWRYFDVTPLRRPPRMGGRERRLQRTFFAARCFCLYDRQARRPSASTADRTSLYVSSWSTHFLGPLRNLKSIFWMKYRPPARLLPTPPPRPSPIQPPLLGGDTLPCWARWKAAFAAGREGRRRDCRRHALSGRGAGGRGG